MTESVHIWKCCLRMSRDLPKELATVAQSEAGPTRHLLSFAQYHNNWSNQTNKQPRMSTSGDGEMPSKHGQHHRRAALRVSRILDKSSDGWFQVEVEGVSGIVSLPGRLFRKAFRNSYDSLTGEYERKVETKINEIKKQNSEDKPRVNLHDDESTDIEDQLEEFKTLRDQDRKSPTRQATRLDDCKNGTSIEPRELRTRTSMPPSYRC